MKKKWTISLLKNSALKYKTIKDWRNNEQSAYVTAKARGVLRELTKHMISLRGEPWTKSRIKNEAGKYKYRADFMRGNESAYQIAWRKGWLDEVCTHMETIGNKNFRLLYSIEIKERNQIYIGLTQNYKKRITSHLSSERFKNIGKKKLIIKKLSSYLSQEEALKKEKALIKNYLNKGYFLLNKTKGGELGTSRKFWTDERILESAKKYKTRKDWKQSNPAAYNASIKSFIHKTATEHMEKILNEKKWNFKEIAKSAKKFQYKQVWRSQEGGAYAASKRLGVYKEVTKHMKKPSMIQKWNREKIIKSAESFNVISHWRKAHQGAFTAACNMGIVKEVTKHMVDGRIGGPNHYHRKWTKAKLMKSAENFNVISHWRRAHQGAVSAAYKMGIIKEVTKHMIDGRSKKFRK